MHALPLIGVYVFLLGLASGLTVLTMTAYRRMSPTWLRWLLIATGLLMLSRYLTMALFTHPEAPQRFWALRHYWFASSIGLTLPSLFAVDQLLKHPAMTPRKLLGWYAPFLVVYATVIVWGPLTPQSSPFGGWIPTLNPAWRWVISIVQSVFVMGFIGVCLMLMRKLPSRPIRIALLGLVLGYGYLGADGLLLVMGGSYFRPFLYSEMVTLLAIWHAYETGASLQHSG